MTHRSISAAVLGIVAVLVAACASAPAPTAFS